MPIIRITKQMIDDAQKAKAAEPKKHPHLLEIEEVKEREEKAIEPRQKEAK